MSALHNQTHASVFSTTQWTIILEAANPDAAESQAAFAQLYRDYWNPLYYYVRRRGYPPADSEDITQSFFVALIEKRRLSLLEREGGRFRSYLLSCLSNFLANEWDRARSLKRGEGRQLISMSADANTVEARYALEQSSGETPETLFEKRWVLTLLGHVMERLRIECAAEGKLGFFEDVHLHLQGERLSADDFTSGTNLTWEIRHESSRHYSYHDLPGHLTIQTQPGGLYEKATNYHNLFLTPMHALALTNYSVVVKVDGFAPDTPFQQAGLVLYNDDDNYFKLVMEPPLFEGPDFKRKPEQKRDLVLLRELDGVAIHGRMPLGGGSGPVWLRLTRVGGRYLGESSLDGKNWDRATMLPWEFYGPDYAGLIAKNGDTSSAKSIPAHFDFFEIREVKTYLEVPTSETNRVRLGN